jgi:hypothetical protein
MTNTQKPERMFYAIPGVADPVAVLRGAAKKVPGGIGALASVIGRSPGVLYSKLCDADERTILGCREADALALHIAGLTGDRGYISEKCLVHGGVFVPLPAVLASDDDALDAHLRVFDLFGVVAREYLSARADGVITAEEFEQLERSGVALIGAVQAFLAQVQLGVREQPEPPGVGLAAVK